MTRTMTRTITAFVLAMSMTPFPALAEVSEEAQEACEKKADEKQLDAVEREAFMTNCLADATDDEE